MKNDSTSANKKPLWDKGGQADLHVLAYTSRDDYVLDLELLPYDLIASKAHVRGLARAGALPKDEAERLVGALEQIEVDVKEGRFTIDPALEDGHTAIEAALVERLGETGKRVHLGRSRNDQVLTAQRLYERAAIDRIAALTFQVARDFLDRAEAGTDIVMPGYTHLQRAVPQTVGHWAAAFAEGLIDAAGPLHAARDLVDKSPLGAAAGYGVNLPLDREGVAKELAFSELDLNPLWSQSSRGLSEVTVLTALWHVLAIVRRFAWDLSLFTTGEFAFVSLPEALTTGSSIMPQKRNPDVVELMRASCSILQGAINELMSLISLPAGYHRDLQLTKAPSMRAFRETEATLRVTSTVVRGMAFRADRMQAAISTDMLATDRAVELAREGMPFRDAYRKVAESLRSEPAGGSATASPEAARKSIVDRVSLGSAGNLGLPRLSARLERMRALFVL